MTITGANLANATGVRFGNNAATIIGDSATQIVVTDPAGGAGTVDVTVTTVGGTSATSSADQFIYESAPTVSGISPVAGPLGGGTTVTITGTNLAGSVAVDFGNSAATIVGDSATQILATDLANSAGTVDVTVTTESGTSATSSTDQFNYVIAPTVSGLTPAAGPLGGGTTVTITGMNLNSATAVSFGDSAATIVSDSATQIVATDPASSAGSVDVTVTTVGGTSATSSVDQFNYVLRRWSPK